MSGKGHAPMRTCIVCRGKKVKESLVRIVVDPVTKLVVADMRKCAPGRGAYVCPECLPRMRFDKRLQRAFRDSVKGLSENMPPTLSAC